MPIRRTPCGPDSAVHVGARIRRQTMEPMPSKQAFS